MASGPLPDRWGVQLYTVRDRMEEDLRGTLEAVAEMGYGEVEFAGLFGWSPSDVRALLDDLGLRAASSHYPMQAIRGDWEGALDVAEILGQSQVILPSLPADARTADGLRALAEELNRAGEAARARGLAFGFHNHDFEVTPLEGPSGSEEGERPLDILLAGTDPALVSFQLDLFWAVAGGTDPVEWFRGHPGRFTSVHVKDRSEAGEMVSVGDGVLDFTRLLSVGAEVGGVRHAFVEHDRPDDSMASIRRGIEHLKTLSF
jgi:sugar phosphate isomerase/epimerase